MAKTTEKNNCIQAYVIQLMAGCVYTVSRGWLLHGMMVSPPTITSQHN